MTTRPWIAASLLLIALPALAQSLAGAVAVPFDRGISHIRWAGQSLTIVSAWRENNNAHGYNAVSIFADAPTGSDGPALLAVPVFERTGDTSQKPRESLTLTTSGGADCTVTNFRLYHLAAPAPLMLVVAGRDMGSSYADTQAVYFDFYRLKVDHEDIAGQPPLSFVFDHRTKASRTYCDVDEALHDELGLPAVRGASLPWLERPEQAEGGHHAATAR